MSSGFRNFENLIKDLFDLKSSNHPDCDEKSLDMGMDLVFKCVRQMCVDEIGSLKDDNVELARYVENLSNRLIRGISIVREKKLSEARNSQNKVEILEDVINLAMDYRDQVKKDLEKIQSIESGDPEKPLDRKVGERPVRLKDQRSKQVEGD